jgi:hypothetical protein
MRPINDHTPKLKAQISQGRFQLKLSDLELDVAIADALRRGLGFSSPPQCGHIPLASVAHSAQ